MTTLSGAEIEKLSKLLATALNEFQLTTIVYSSTGDQLYVEYVAAGKPLRKTIEELLIALNGFGTVCLFLAAVYGRYPNRTDVRAAIAGVCPDVTKQPAGGGAGLAIQRAGQPEKEAPTDAFAPGFQRNVRPHLTKLDVHVWLEKLAQIERRVCRIEFAGNAAGSGFLVGPDAVLTNWHVVENAKQSNKLADLACRFDYLRLANGTRQQGKAVALHADGCLDFSRYSAAEKTKKPDEPPPTEDELDYALLRLAEPVGRGDADGSPRGWISLPEAAVPLDAGAPLLIVQHPDGSPMKLALDTEAVIGRNANRTRIRYKTNTDPGASGSPCFTMDWDLAALHHYGDPAWQQPMFNQGIPIELIRRRIIEKGLLASING
jgi:hypothetical protein